MSGVLQRFRAMQLRIALTFDETGLHLLQHLPQSGFNRSISPLIVFKPAVPRPWRGETPETLSSPILSGMPGPHAAAPRLAVRR
jgi:hypothetical protein